MVQPLAAARRRSVRVARGLVALLVTAPSTAAAQVVKLDQPTATLSETFSFVRGARELSTGQLLVADWIENRVVLADSVANSVRRVMREGPGPQVLDAAAGR